jgi:hypothetical protein
MREKPGASRARDQLTIAAASGKIIRAGHRLIGSIAVRLVHAGRFPDTVGP